MSQHGLGGVGKRRQGRGGRGRSWGLVGWGCIAPAVQTTAGVGRRWSSWVAHPTTNLLKRARLPFGLSAFSLPRPNKVTLVGSPYTCEAPRDILATKAPGHPLEGWEV